MTETVKLGENGRIVLPVAIRNKYNLKTGDILTIIAEDNCMQIMSIQMALNDIREGIIKKRGSLEGILEEFMEERRQEAKREYAEMMGEEPAELAHE